MAGGTPRRERVVRIKRARAHRAAVTPTTEEVPVSDAAAQKYQECVAAAKGQPYFCIWCFVEKPADNPGKQCTCGHYGVTKHSQRDKSHIYVETVEK